MTLRYAKLTDAPVDSLNTIKERVAANIPEAIKPMLVGKVQKMRKFDDLKITGNTMSLESGHNKMRYVHEAITGYSTFIRKYIGRAKINCTPKVLCLTFGMQFNYDAAYVRYNISDYLMRYWDEMERLLWTRLIVSAKRRATERMVTLGQSLV